MSDDEIRALAEALVFVARDLDGRLYPFSGVVRRAARVVLDLDHRLQRAGLEPADRGCAWCGAPLHQRGRGRPRRYCSPRCRRAAGRNGAKH